MELLLTIVVICMVIGSMIERLDERFITVGPRSP